MTQMTTQMDATTGTTKRVSGGIVSNPLTKPAPIRSAKKPGRMQDDLDFL